MKILITGLTGFIGKNFYKYSKFKNDILAISRKGSVLKNFNSEDLNYIDCGLEDINKFTTEIKRFNPDCVLNFAWGGIPDYSEDISNNNLNLTLDFFNFLEKNTNIKKFINTGTCAEYFNPTGKIDENYPVKPYDHFSSAKIKLSQELGIKCLKSKITYVNLRLFYVFGAYQRNESLIPYLINSYKKGTIPKLSKPFSRLDYVYVEDVIRVMDNCIKNDISSGAYNVGSGQSISNYEIQRFISNKFNYDFDENTYHEQESDINFFADITKLNSKLNWTPKFKVYEGIKKMFRDLNNNY